MELETFDAHSITACAAAIDFGASNTDVAAVVDGGLMIWTQATAGKPTPELVRQLAARTGVPFRRLRAVAVTGGHSQALPETLDGVPVHKIGELAAIARGGQALASGSAALPGSPLLVVSAGSGTAMVAANGPEYRHVTGTGMGGGTLLGLGRLLLGTIKPEEIDALAARGNPNGADLAILDVVTGPIGALPPDATAVNFGRVAQMATRPADEDLAAALVTMVGQVVATLAINAARAAGVPRIVVTGHLTDMPTLRRTMHRVGEFFGMPLELSPQAGYATVTGALLRALDQ